MVVDNVRLLFLLSAQQGYLYSNLFFAYQMARVEAATACCAAESAWCSKLQN